MSLRISIQVAFLSAATLLLESTLTRLLAIAQFYHFAFLVVSLALLGFGASGTVLSVFPKLRELPFDILFPRVGLGFFLSVLFTLGVVNLVPFDSYSIAWEGKQIVYFFLYYLALSIPFFVSGLGIGAALAGSGGKRHLIYAANLIGSGIGALLAPVAIHISGVTGAVIASGSMALFLLWGKFKNPISIWVRGTSPNLGSTIRDRFPWQTGSRFFLYILVLTSCGFLILQGVYNTLGRAPLLMKTSPYKGLSQALRYPGSKILYRRWNAISRLDVVSDAGIHLFPGLSYIYSGDLPEQYGLSIDAEAIKPITLVQPSKFTAAEYLPESIAFELSSGDSVLILEPAAGLGVLQALSRVDRSVEAVISNALIKHALTSSIPEANIYANPLVNLSISNGRSFLERSDNPYNVIYIPLTDPYRPVMSGAYSLSEDYSLTVEAFKTAISRLSKDGFLVATRWLQTPPSEGLRLFTTINEALRQLGISNPAQCLIAYRSIQTLTIMVKPLGWNSSESDRVRSFTEQHKFDLVWLPDIQIEEVNRFNRTPEPSLYLAVREILDSENPDAFYEKYPIDIKPPSDDHPFFFHFFKWNQTPEILATIGKTWQPFGGSGYLILFAFLILAVILSIVLIVFPIVGHRKYRFGLFAKDTSVSWQGFRYFLYFLLLGIGFLFIEIPLIQRWILFMGQPIYAFTLVVLIVLLFSGLGSSLSNTGRFPKVAAFAGLVVLVLITPLAINRYSIEILGYQPLAVVFISILILAPMSFLMGLPFPLGLALMDRTAPQLVPWAWAINGCASVIASVLAAILALGYGFSTVLTLGASAYLGAFIIFMVERSR